MPRPGRVFTRPDYGIALLAALAAFWLYYQTLGPTITGEDSGEFITAAYTLGIPHPPGYPLYCLLGHLFTWLPRGEIAWRVNLMSACFGAGTVYMVTLLVVYLSRNRFAALTAALILACSREFWAQSLVADVYSMNAFFFAFCLLLVMLWEGSRNKSFLFLFAFIFGLAVTVHYTFILLAPVFALYVFFSNLFPGKDKISSSRLTIKNYLLLCAVAVLGLFPFFYLPIRSLSNPAVDWGNPETLHNLYHVLRRSQFEFMFHQYPHSLERFLGQMMVYGRFWLANFQPWGAVLGTAGLLLLLRRHCRYGLLLLVSSVVVLAGFTYWQNFEQTREWFWVMRVFALPAYVVTAIGIGIAIEALWKRHGVYTLSAVMLALLCVCASLYLYWEDNDKSSYYWTRDYGMNLLESLPPNAMYVSDSDHASFSILYLQHVLGIRTDVESLRKYGYLSSDLFEEIPEELRKKAGEFPRRRYEAELLAALLKHTDRPLYLAKPMALSSIPGIRYIPAGPAFQVLRPNEKASEHNCRRKQQWHTLTKKNTHNDYTADAIRYEIAMIKAQAAFITARDTDPKNTAAKQKEALAHIEEALHAYSRDSAVLNNAGVVCARYGLYRQAHDYFCESLNTLPTQSDAHHNLERVKKHLTQTTATP